jgi:hypothetical protein
MKWRSKRKQAEEMRAEAGMVNTHAQTMFLATPQCTAVRRWTLPTPIMPPAMV